MKTQPIIPATPSPAPVVAAIESLRALLVKHYGCDFAFTVMAKGRRIAASTATAGDVRPVAQGAPTPRRIELSETAAAGNRDPLNVRYHVNGQRVDREAFAELQRAARAAGTWESLGSARAMGNEVFYYAATLALPASL